MAFPRTKGTAIGEKARNPKPGVPLKKEQILPLLKYYHGNLSRVADKLGTTRGCVRRVIERDPQLAEALSDARERFVDQLEECSWHKALNGDGLLQLFLLKTIGKSRGYDQDPSKNAAQDIAKAAFDFVINKTKNPADPSTH